MPEHNAMIAYYGFSTAMAHALNSNNERAYNLLDASYMATRTRSNYFW